MNGRGNPVEVWDYLDLLLLRLAKIGRRKLSGSEESADFYDEFFTDNDVTVMASGGDPRRHCRGQVLREAALANMPPGAAVLDVGCGVGDNLRYILHEGAFFFGLEYSERTAEIARKVLGGRATVHVGSAKAIPHESNSFDLVLCIEVIEHIDDDGAACREIARVLKPGGVVILSVPYRHWFPFYEKAMGHFRHYTRQDVEQLLEPLGLRIERYLPNFPRWSRFANYIYVTCRICCSLYRLVGVRSSPLDVKLPGAARPLIAHLFSPLEGLRSREENLDYSKLDTSTFVVARKVVDSLPW